MNDFFSPKGKNQPVFFAKYSTFLEIFMENSIEHTLAVGEATVLYIPSYKKST